MCAGPPVRERQCTETIFRKGIVMRIRLLMVVVVLTILCGIGLSGDVNWKFDITDAGIRFLAAEGRVCRALGLSCPGSVRERSGPPEIVILLDRSGSMEDMESKMEEAVGSFLTKQREAVPMAVATLVQFDDRYEQVYARKSLVDLPRVDIQPRGRTALLDALGRTINEVAKETNAAKVIFVVITDGLENDSKEYKRPKVFELIRHMRELHGWEFVYLGANQDAIAVAGDLGIVHSWNYDLTSVSTVVDTAANFTTLAITDPNWK